ncbi:MAG: BamA/TamA family outer membrane protein [Acidobacteriia bacterium]|nr:BamA/TamA family outer membrane protein [Terriglobia bacterium]
MLRYQPVSLVLLLAGVCALSARAQQPSSSSAPPSATPAVPASPQSAVQPAASLPAGPEGAQISGGLNRLEGAPVASVQIRCESIQHPEWLQPLLAQRAGAPLDKYKVRQTVQALYNTGLFSNIEVEAERNAQGEIALVFRAVESYFFGSVRVEGSSDQPTGTQLANASKLVLGEQFTEARISTGIESMQHILRENGYYEARIQTAYEWDPPNQQVKVLFTVTRGPRAKVGAIHVLGTPGLELQQIMDAAGLHPGDTVSAPHMNHVLRRLRKKYQKDDRLQAQVTVTRRDYHPENNTLDYTFDIVEGPRVDVKVEGAKLSSGLVKKFVPIYEENALDEDLLNEGSRKIRDYFQTKGFFDAKVTYSERPNPAEERREIIFNIDRGDRHKVLEIDIVGNKYFPRETIRERMEVQPAGGLLLSGLFSQSMVARDTQAILNLYHDNGFLQVKVVPNVQDNYQGEVGRLKISINIEEGPQTLVGKLNIDGNSAIPDEALREIIVATEGQPYSDANVANDQTEVTNYYFNHGFPEVRFEAAAHPLKDAPERMEVTYRITEGPQIFLDKILVSGLHYTKPFIVEREEDEVEAKRGEALSQEKTLDLQRRLYDLGIFNSVDMAVQNPEGDATRKNLNVQIEEARRYTFNYGIGFEVQTGQPTGSATPQGKTGASARVLFDVTRLNFRGRDHTITLQTRYGNLQKRALISYGAPRWWDNPNLTMNITALYDDTFNVRTFEARRLEGSLEIKQSVNKATTLLYRFTYRRVSIPSTSLLIDPNLVPLFSQPVRVGIPAFTYIRDTRDDPTDSHKGAFLTVDTGVASRIFGSQASFSRLLMQNSSYYRFHRKRWVFARSTRIGFEKPFSSTDFIALPERFFAGGSNSHRGFGINQAGPRDLKTGFPLGGEAILVNNLELRTPPLPLPLVGNDLSAVVFHDMGNVFATAGDIADSFFRYSQPDRSTCTTPGTQTCSFNFMAHAVGVGARYRTPVGPLSFDMGYNLNPPVFPVGLGFQKLRRFNFSFSIGQTF